MSGIHYIYTVTEEALKTLRDGDMDTFSTQVRLVAKKGEKAIADLFRLTVSYGQVKMASALLMDSSLKIDVNRQGPIYQNTALHNAVLCGKEEMVDLILEHGGDPRIGNRFDETALQMAERKMPAVAPRLKIAAEQLETQARRVFGWDGRRIPIDRYAIFRQGKENVG